MNRKLIGLIAGLGISLSTTTHAQNVWDAVGDFNLNANPNGAWTYSWQSPSGGPLYPMAAYPGADCGSPGVICWTRYDGYPVPQVALNTATSPIEYGSGVVPLSVRLLHPGADGERAVVTWKAPHTSGKVRYLVVGSFQLLDYHNYHYGLGGVYVTASIDGKKEKDGTLNTFGVPMKFDFHKCLKPGQTISFTVDANGNYANDLTALKVGILRSREFDEAAPEQQTPCN